MDVSSLTPLLHRALSMGCVCLKPSIMVEEVKYKVKHELAEGGFSTIDLVEDTRTGREFVIKRITCHSTEDQNVAIREIQMHRQFGDHRNILEVVRSDITGTADIVHNTTSQVNIVLPYFQVIAQNNSYVRFKMKNIAYIVYIEVSAKLFSLFHFLPERKFTR